MLKCHFGCAVNRAGVMFLQFEAASHPILEAGACRVLYSVHPILSIGARGSGGPREGPLYSDKNVFEKITRKKWKEKKRGKTKEKGKENRYTPKN